MPTTIHTPKQIIELRRPMRSAQRPIGTSAAAKTIVYALSTQDSELRLVPG